MDLNICNRMVLSSCFHHYLYLHGNKMLYITVLEMVKASTKMYDYIYRN